MYFISISYKSILDVSRANGKTLGILKTNIPKDFIKGYDKLKKDEYKTMSASRFDEMLVLVEGHFINTLRL